MAAAAYEVLRFGLKQAWACLFGAALLGLLLVALFIWFGETIGTAGGAWRYPSQMKAWHPVPPAKLASRLLLMLVSYTLVAGVEGRSRIAARPPRHSGGTQEI